MISTAEISARTLGTPDRQLAKAVFRAVPNVWDITERLARTAKAIYADADAQLRPLRAQREQLELDRDSRSIAQAEGRTRAPVRETSSRIGFDMKRILDSRDAQLRELFKGVVTLANPRVPHQKKVRDVLLIHLRNEVLCLARPQTADLPDLGRFRIAHPITPGVASGIIRDERPMPFVEEALKLLDTLTTTVVTPDEDEQASAGYLERQREERGNPDLRVSTASARFTLRLATFALRHGFDLERHVEEIVSFARQALKFSAYGKGDAAQDSGVAAVQESHTAGVWHRLLLHLQPLVSEVGEVNLSEEHEQLIERTLETFQAPVRGARLRYSGDGFSFVCGPRGQYTAQDEDGLPPLSRTLFPELVSQLDFAE
ncbi:hypothetical protein [Deinococcus sonorensis]|uniref:Uncharacterized protein n=1 Tax=Deinococcus sonorensis TaxID=309891 RepID=A0ABV8YC82_9DEIO